MKFRAPMYYKEFQCIADKCKDSCCSAGWEIDIDAKTENFYKNVHGDFGDKLRENICWSDSADERVAEKYFAENFTSESNSSEKKSTHFLLDKNKNCPFLNEKKLCDIYINLGEKYLCQICKDHPRFYEWFDGVKEAGIGLCCEEAARVILSQNGAFSFYEEEEVDGEDISCNYDVSDCYNIELYDYLFSAREKIINYLDNPEIPLKNKLRNILWYTYTLQQDIDNDLLDDEEIFDVNSDDKASIKPIIEYISTFEPNNESWPNYLKKCAKLSFELDENLANFESSNYEIENYLKNVSIYFIWRYFLKGVFDGDVLSKVKLMYVSFFILKYLFFCKWFECGKLCLEDCIDIVKKYSEEIEYSEENLMKFANDSYDSYYMEILSTEKLICVFI